MNGMVIGFWTRCRIFAAALGVVLAPVILGSVQAEAATAQWFNIPAQPLAKALIQFGLQADLSIGYRGLDFQKQNSNALKGYDTPQGALAHLLRGSHFTFEVIDPETIRIVRQSAKPTPSPIELATPKPKPLDTRHWINEVLVTLTKRPSELQSVPYSAVAITGADLDSTGAGTAHDLTSMVAGVTATNLGVGRDKFTIRGLSDGNFTGHTQSTVGLYLDETRITFNAPDPGLQLVDIDRVEVVRGPQGTLYGAGSLGGLIRIITNKPVLSEFEAAVSGDVAATDHGRPSADVQAMINVPIVTDRFGMRIVGYGRHEGGYIDDVRLGKKDVNRTNISGARFSTRWDLGPRWRIQTSTSYQSIVARDTQYYQPSLGHLVRANYVPEPHDNDFLDTSLVINADLPWATLVSSTAFVRHSVKSQYDASLSIPVILGLPVMASPFNESSLYRTIDQETRLTSAPGKRFHWLLGTFLSHRDDEYNATLDIPAAGGGYNTAYSEYRANNGDEYAVFGEFTYNLTDRLSVTGGMRLFHARLHVRSSTDGTANTQPGSAVGANHKNGMTPKGVISFQATPDKLFYALVSKGFRLGGVNVNSPISVGSDGQSDSDGHGATVSNFASDTLYNFEIGAKTAWFDHRLIANGAIFYTIWNNIQSDQLRPTGFIYTTNVGDARNYGLELDITAQPTDALRLRGSLFLNNSNLSHVNPSLSIIDDGRLPGVPRITGSFSIRYQHEFGRGWVGAILASFSANGRSRLTFDRTNSPSIGGHALADLRLSIAREHWRAELYVDNITNDDTNIFPFGDPFSIRYIEQKTPPRPRTVGLKVGWTY